MKDEVEQYYASSRQKWRQWLQKNHVKKQSVWLVCYKKKADKPTIAWTDAVDEALCFGWIDSIRKSLDDETFIQFFSKRKPKSVWSKINKDKIVRLVASGEMTQAGLDSIEIAKANGSWTIMDSVEELKVPTDLSKKLKTSPIAKKYFNDMPKSEKKRMLHWIITAKQAETRERRIDKLVEAAGKQTKPI